MDELIIDLIIKQNWFCIPIDYKNEDGCTIAMLATDKGLISSLPE